MTAKPEPKDQASRLARVEVSPALMAALLQMPPGWRIERMNVRAEDPERNTPNVLNIVFSSPDLPELLWGDRIPAASVWLTVEDGRLTFDWNIPEQAGLGKESAS